MIPLADSNITKRALASALRELMQEMPFEKITVSHICDKCDMNRKSFYYHFRDKYDLVNWIFDTEFITLLKSPPTDKWSFFEITSKYFYENRAFYRKALQIKGQNSFSEHLREFMYPLIQSRIAEIIGQNEVPQLCVDFMADGLICTTERWLMDKNCMPPEKFLNTVKPVIEAIAADIYHETEC
ncbi:putative dihydroxyacetone kinase regulator [Marvinbryantia formatexigens DSM 14469]|uniref:Dihydroxyacetone kinase regulator n=2 Tax=Marvinbryantia TaxID=248744 RepID=C6LIZ7_9FIRM|nr:TetR/AcrR family transcriptional regulator C-terminal domain-containing protein [Marvinbryantia formatexigens]EET59317.1 putative dihydroxyacetone kinase regulator [Marvinbryantia formatexigens DSM 14469]